MFRTSTGVCGVYERRRKEGRQRKKSPFFDGLVIQENLLVMYRHGLVSHGLYMCIPMCIPRHTPSVYTHTCLCNIY